MSDEVREVVRLIRQGEGQTVEFKKKANHPEKIVREVVAFANAEGGHLFVGVDDDGTISGLKHPEEEEYVLTHAIKDLCKPLVSFSVNILQVGEVEILHYEIPEGTRKPYFAHLQKNHKYGKAFIRVMDQSIQTSYEMRQFLKRRGRNAPLIVFEEKTRQLFEYFHSHDNITLSEYMELSGLDKKDASGKLIELTLSGALKIEPRTGEDIFSPIQEFS